MSLHARGDFCQYCDTWCKRDAHPRLYGVWKTIKKAFPDCHIAQVFRNKEDQEKDVAEKKSMLHWPFSCHNAEFGGMPRSRALDLFKLDEKEQAVWDKNYYKAIADFLSSEAAPIHWGGNWVSFKDFPHFELIPEVPQNP